MGNRDIWKISRRPSSTSSYQGNMYILIATESARNPVKKGAKVWSGFAVTFSFWNVFFLHLSDHQSVPTSSRPCSGFLALQGSLKCHGIAVKTTSMAVVQLPKSLENRSTATPLVGIPGRPCLRWTSRTVFFVTQRKKRKAAEAMRHLPVVPWSLPKCNSAQRCSNINDARILMRKDDVCSWRSTSWQTFMRRKWCTMPLPTESTPAPSPFHFVAIANKENAKSPSDHDWAQWQLPDKAFRWPQWSRSGSPMLIVLWVY